MKLSIIFLLTLLSVQSFAKRDDLPPHWEPRDRCDLNWDSIGCPGWSPPASDEPPRETVWQCTLTDKRGRKWVGQHKNKKQSCVVARAKCVRNTSKANCY